MQGCGVAKRLHSFQFTPLREGRRRTETNFFIVMNFNSRPSARGDRKKVAIRQHDCNFNSRPSARGDMLPITFCSEKLFQFTPLREGRLGYKAAIQRILHFNSRPSARGDDRVTSGELAVWVISIHAPPRGATRTQFPHWSSVNFNSRPSARGDKADVIHLLTEYKFQFTPLREGRPRSWAAKCGWNRFQFTPLREGRPAA